MRKAAPWPTGCTLVWPDSGEQRKFQSLPSSAFVSSARHDYDELTPEISKGLFLTAPPSSSKAIKGCGRNREAGLVAEKTRKLEGWILKSRRKKERKKERRKEDSSTLTNKQNSKWVRTFGWKQGSQQDDISPRCAPCSSRPMRLPGAFLGRQATAATAWFTHMTRFCKAIKWGVKGVHQPPEESNIFSSSLPAQRRNEVWEKVTKRQVSQDCTQLNKMCNSLSKCFAFPATAKMASCVYTFLPIVKIKLLDVCFYSVLPVYCLDRHKLSLASIIHTGAN